MFSIPPSNSASIADSKTIDLSFDTGDSFADAVLNRALDTYFGACDGAVPELPCVAREEYATRAASEMRIITTQRELEECFRLDKLAELYDEYEFLTQLERCRGFLGNLKPDDYFDWDLYERVAWLEEYAYDSYEDGFNAAVRSLREDMKKRMRHIVKLYSTTPDIVALVEPITNNGKVSSSDILDMLINQKLDECGIEFPCWQLNSQRYFDGIFFEDRDSLCDFYLREGRWDESLDALYTGTTSAFLLGATGGIDAFYEQLSKTLTGNTKLPLARLRAVMYPYDDSSKYHRFAIALSRYLDAQQSDTVSNYLHILYPLITNHHLPEGMRLFDREIYESDIDVIAAGVPVEDWLA